jgi:hypothetical protein
MNGWLVLITTLTGESATARQRAWRALKACGAAVLRDGVYLLPAGRRDAFANVAADIRGGEGTALILEVDEPEDADFAALFDRRESYATLLTEAARTRADVSTETVRAQTRVARRLRRAFEVTAEIDFFPDAAQRQTDAALRELEVAIARALSPDEPRPVAAEIPSRAVADFQGRTWATRARPWVDRLASAWLIRRFIDPDARIRWLANPADCPADALGFDFDGATFSHVGERVTFEVLAASFGLTQPALARVGALVHYLDVGGVAPAEAAGIETVLAGLRDALDADDALMAAADAVFDGLLAAFARQESEA